ncbi:MAG: M16 family metallopeptidase [Acidobacteriota bacterium]
MTYVLSRGQAPLKRVTGSQVLAAGRFALLGLALTSLVLAQGPDRSRPPELGPPPSVKFPPVSYLKLANGLPVLLMEKHQVPVVQINLIVRAGSVQDPAERRGLASMAMDMLDEGAGSLSALQVADAIDFLGARLSTSAGFHTSRIALHSPLKRLDGALSVMADVVLHPTFAGAELERLRRRRLTALLQSHDESRAIAGILFPRLLYGTSHPYGEPQDLEGPIRSIQVDDLKTFHSAFFHPGNAVLIAVGDLSPETLLPLLETHFGSWSTAPVSHHEPPRSSKPNPVRKVWLVDKPGAAQSEIRIGQIGVRRLSPDYDKLVVLNTLLGGSFTSRLNQNLREEHGYSYGAFSRFDFRVLPGPFVAQAAVHTEVTAKALTEFMKELDRIREPVTDEELARARNFVALRYPARFQTVSGIARQLEEKAVYGLPADYFDTYTKRILAVTADQLLETARHHLDPQRMAIVVVGDRSRIEEGIRQLNLGPLELLSVDDVLGPAPKLEGPNQ